MKKGVSILSATFMLVASFTMFNMNSSSAKVEYYKQGKFTEDSNGTCVYVCPHSDGDSNCV